MDAEDESSADVQVKVLQDTLTALSSNHDGTGPDSAKECCVICLDTISENCEAVPCGHRNLDFLCLASWLQQRATCPLCKAKIQEIRYEFSEDEKKWQTFHVPKIGLEKAPDLEEPWRDESFRTRGSERFLQNETRLPQPEARPRRLYDPFSLSDPETSFHDTISMRRRIYCDGLFSLHMGSSPASGYRDRLTPEMFVKSPASDLVSRAKAWIRRELCVFEYLSPASGRSGNEDIRGGGGGGSDGRSMNRGSGTRSRQTENAEFVLEYIIAILKTVDIQGSCGQAEELLKDFLGFNTRLFLHELSNFLRSPYSVEGWDRHVQYDESKATRGKAPERHFEHRPRNRESQRYRSSRESRTRQQQFQQNRQAHHGGVSRHLKADRYRPG